MICEARGERKNIRTGLEEIPGEDPNLGTEVGSEALTGRVRDDTFMVFYQSPISRQKRGSGAGAHFKSQSQCSSSFIALLLEVSEGQQGV